MRRFIWFLLILSLSVWIGLKIAKDPGVALFVYRQWSIEMPLWFALGSIIAILFLGYFFLRFFDNITSAFQHWGNWLRWRRKNKAYSKTNRGLVELIEGHWKISEYYLLEGVAQSDAPLINYLAAAKAAHEQRAFERRDAYLRKAHHFAPHAEVAIGLTQANLQLEQGQLESALAILNHLCSIAPRHDAVIKLLERVYIHLGDWKNLLNLLPVLRETKIIAKEYLDKLEIKVYEELLKSTLKTASAPALRALWHTIPKKLKQNPPLAYCYTIQLLHHAEAANELEEVLYKNLKKSWHKELARLYGLLVTTDSRQQLAHAEGLLRHYKNEGVMLLTTGRLCMRCQLWGKARHYFETSLSLEANPETYMEYGKLLELSNDWSSAAKNYHEGLKLAVSKASATC